MSKLSFGSLFAGIVCNYLCYATISRFFVENYMTVIHKLNSEFLKLVVPISMLLPVCNRKILNAIIMFVEVDVMNNFPFAEWSSDVFCYYKYMFCDITRTVGVWVRWHQDVVVAISKRSSFATLPLFFSGQNTASTPASVFITALVSLSGYARLYPHLSHSSPHNLLRRPILQSYFGLRHPKDFVIIQKFLFGKRNAVCILITHAGIISNASSI